MLVSLILSVQQQGRADLSAAPAVSQSTGPLARLFRVGQGGEPYG